MSVNYHAFQSRGVLFSEYEVVCEQWRERFTEYDPSRIARILGLESDDSFLFVLYLGERYRLRLSDGVLEKQTDQEWSEALLFNEAMAVYHLLTYTADVPVVSGRWVPSHSIDGVVSRSQKMPDPLFASFCREWRGRRELLADVCEKAGGTLLPGEKGDVVCQFEIFPRICFRLVFWDEDEDFPAQVQILLDQNITDFVHYETVGCMISDLFEKLQKEGRQGE